MKAADFESAASTNSATWAGSFKGCNVTTFSSIENKEFLNKFQNYLQQDFLGSTTDLMMRTRVFTNFIVQSSIFFDDYKFT